MYSRILFLCLLLLSVSGTPLLADTIKLKDTHPDHYVVVKGDTLWAISSQFLEDPWLWPEIWQLNPTIKNPHLIYPGDTISLIYVDGKPQLRINRGRPTVKFSPKTRFSKLENAISTIPADAIKQFLLYSLIISEEELAQSGYVVAHDEGKLMSGTGDKIYVRGITPESGDQLHVIRPGDAYRNPGAKKNDVLGYEALQIADAKALRFGDPTTLGITHATREILIGDRILPITDEEKLDQFFIPHAPDKPIEGSIISVLNGVSRIGQYHTVVLNKGSQDNLEIGHVLVIHQTGDIIRDTVAKRGQKVQLPKERAGIVMVVRTFDRVSYGLVMEAYRDMRVYDTFTEP